MRFPRGFARPKSWPPAALPLLVALAVAGCSRLAPSERSVTFIDTGPWVKHDFSEWRSAALERFTRETGIKVKLLPEPESPSQQLAMHLRLLRQHAVTPDVFAVDVIWPGMMAEHLLDLGPLVGGEAKDHFPAILANDTVGGRLVALPYRTDMGLLFYRADLLRQYGFPSPPATWGELERMARAILEKERAKGNMGLRGFVWAGVADESLTCTALEWQASEGGGSIVEADGTVSVNNARAAAALSRASGWIGALSPPGIAAYREWDAQSTWLSGDAIFMRDWPARYASSEAEDSAVRGKFDVAPLPGGAAGSAATLGGYGLAVSRYSRHQAEAVALVRFLCRKDIQLWRSTATSILPTIPSIYDDPQVLRANPLMSRLKTAPIVGLVARPSTATGAKYGQVSSAYFTAVHRVLTGERTPQQALAEAEAGIVRITGFKPGPVPSPPSLRRSGR